MRVDTERWRRLEQLFHRAADLPDVDRAKFLDAECGDDATLRAEVERLLANDRVADDAFSRFEAAKREPAVDPLLGRTLGVWALKERLGEGGMGVVYRAERADGLFAQEVAIKLVRAERASDWSLRRFEFERRTLAALQHPSIARLYDGGTTEDGRPYFVMELVRGEPIGRWCEARRLTLERRLELFVRVCRAVQFAHQNLVVHCDLKPANVLIDAGGEPHLLDFGIARLVEEEPELDLAAPRTLTRVLTPEYASPEQLAGKPPTTSIDVYALGVMLYELVTGRRPFATESRSPAEWERLVREADPEKPSTRVLRPDATREPEAIAAALASTPSSLRRALRGDLDRIVLMALRKEPERRYASAQELADDVERQLRGEAVRARGDSFGYLASKFVRRHRVAVFAGVVVLAALVVGYVSARRAERRAAAEAEHARAEADSFQNVAGFLMDAFLPTQPAEDPAWQSRARERVLAHAGRVRRQFADDDHERANLLDTLGRVAQRLELVDDARTLIGEAAAIREHAFGADSLEYAISLRHTGELEFQLGAFPAAIDALTRALEIHRAHAEDRHASVDVIANDLASCLRNVGRAAEAEALHREALALRRARGGGLPLAESLNNLAGVHIDRGELALATEELREALSIRETILGEAELLTAQTRSNLATVLWRAGERDEAEREMRSAESAYRQLGFDGEDGLSVVLSNLSAMQLTRRDYAAAAASLDEASALQSRRFGADHPLVASTLVQLAVLHHAQRRDDRARECWTEALRIRRAISAPRRELAETLYGFGVFLSDVEECDRALPLFEEALGLHRGGAAPGEEPLGDAVACGRVEYALGLCLERLERLDEARTHLERAAELFADPAASAEERERVATRLAGLVR